METNTIIRVLENVHLLLENRGHNVDELNKNISKSMLLDKIEKFRADNTALDIYISQPKKVYVKFLKTINEKGETAIKELDRIYNIVSDVYKFNRDDEFIFVVFDDVKKEVLNIENKHDNITFFTHKKLLINIIDNIYVPKHTRLSIQDRKALKKSLNIESFNNLPILFKSDAISRYYNYKEGDVIRIDRPSRGNKTHTVYRYVISDDSQYLGTV